MRDCHWEGKHYRECSSKKRISVHWQTVPRKMAEVQQGVSEHCKNRTISPISLGIALNTEPWVCLICPPPPKGIWLVISRKIKPIFCCRMMSGSSFLDCSSRISRSDKIHQNSWQQTFYEGLWRVIVLDTYWRRNIFCSMLSLLSDWYQVIFNQAIDLRKLRFSNLENLKIFNIELWMVGQ